MAGWSGGTFTRARDWTDDEDGGVDPTATRFDEEDDNLAAGINACLHKGGQNTVTADINWGGFKVTNLGAPTSDNDAARKTYVDNSGLVEALDLTNGGADDQASLDFSHTLESGYVYRLVIRGLSSDTTAWFPFIRFRNDASTWLAGASDYTISNMVATVTDQVNTASSGILPYAYSGAPGLLVDNVVDLTADIVSAMDVSVRTRVLCNVSVTALTASTSCVTATASGVTEVADGHNGIRIGVSPGFMDGGKAMLFRTLEPTF